CRLTSGRVAEFRPRAYHRFRVLARRRLLEAVIPDTVLRKAILGPVAWIYSFRRSFGGDLEEKAAAEVESFCVFSGINLDFLDFFHGGHGTLDVSHGRLQKLAMDQQLAMKLATDGGI